MGKILGWATYRNQSADSSKGLLTVSVKNVACESLVLAGSRRCFHVLAKHLLYLSTMSKSFLYMHLISVRYKNPRFLPRNALGLRKNTQILQDVATALVVALTVGGPRLCVGRKWPRSRRVRLPSTPLLEYLSAFLGKIRGYGGMKDERKY